MHSINAYIFLLATIALVISHSLARPLTAIRAKDCLVFIIALLLTAYSIRESIGGVGFESDNDASRVYARTLAQLTAANEQDDRTQKRVVLIVGSSLTAMGLNPRWIEDALSSSRSDVEIHTFSVGGLNIFEQDYYVDKLIEELARPPDIILLEVSHVWDEKIPVGWPKSSLLARRAIVYSDLTRAFWATRLLADHPEPFTSDVRSIGVVFANAIHRLLNLGTLNTLVRRDEIAPLDSFTPFNTTKDNFSTRDLERGLRDLEAPLPNFLAADSIGRPLRRFREYQRDKYQTRGVPTIGYFSPPSLDLEHRTHAKAFCATAEERFCSDAEASTLRVSLSGEQIWFNQYHLQEPGAKLYSSWLATEISHSGLLR